MRINSLNLLYPPIGTVLRQALSAARIQALHAYAFETWRSTERQAFLYAQGRTTDGARVTWVRPGFSYHEYGVAVDLVFDGSSRDGIQWAWEGKYAEDHRVDYVALASIMKAHGFEWLGDRGTEMAHFQVTFGFSTKQMKQIVEAKGLLGLWAEFDKIIEKNGGKI